MSPGKRAVVPHLRPGTSVDTCRIHRKPKKKIEIYKKILSTALKGIAIAMGVAVIVLNTLGTLTNEAVIPLIGIGLTTLGIEALQMG